MPVCSKCEHCLPGGNCAVWIHRQHFEYEAANCQTYKEKDMPNKLTASQKNEEGAQKIHEDLVIAEEMAKTAGFAKLGAEIGNLVEEKAKAYGDWNVPGQMLRLLYPDGVKPEQVDDMLTIVRILDKLRRIATKKDAFGESPYRDIIGYAMQGVKKDEQTKR